ncbi:urease accessory protein UreE [Sphingobacterium psychroaquaticum]|uniref:Urease accessory protein UreE n=1 Tax=Sphingobacterium psychroaquaticum TaxID=561061 RepID=A0A1X7KDY9_9SPHI|nr:urease accessory protein UreE [Sphingobacterium psychroaquaticum]SMG39079.1 urease accessory protein [Sphingobacterium psychroaquaticum]
MIVTSITQNIHKNPSSKKIDFLHIAWYQATKRIQRLRSIEGTEIAIRLLGHGQALHDGDILFENDEKIVVVRIDACESLSIRPQNVLEAAFISAEIGNKHLPLFHNGEELLLPYEKPMHQWLIAQGYQPSIAERQLLHPFTANVDPIHHRTVQQSTKKIKLLIQD